MHNKKYSYIDITQTIESNMAKYSSDPDVIISQFKSLKKGNSCNLVKLSMGSHTGTHIDAPSHMLDRGGGIDSIALHRFFCRVYLGHVKDIAKKDFFKKLKMKNAKGILLKGKNQISGLSVKAAELLTKNRISLIGTERMSIENPGDSTHTVHKILLKKNVLIIECLNLKNVKTGFYDIICFPLKIKNCDGAPARVLLQKIDNSNA